jgi:hypothetical protein
MWGRSGRLSWQFRHLFRLVNNWANLLECLPNTVQQIEIGLK